MKNRPHPAGMLLLFAALAMTACGPSSAPVHTLPPATATPVTTPPPTPKAVCGPGSRPESGLQGRLSLADIDSGLATGGISCNAEVVGQYRAEEHYATVGGWKVMRYVDNNGHECAYYDATSVFPLGAVFDDAIGVNVMDMSDPAHPQFIEHLITPAMLTPHESLLLNQARGLLVAVMSNPAAGPGVVDVYDVSQDCRHPVLKSVSPVGTIGHESGFSPDGLTFYSANPFTPTLTAVDMTNPSLPLPVKILGMSSHGLSLSADGNRAYIADTTGGGKLRIIDTSEVQARKPQPKTPVISELTWSTASIPQNVIPFTSKGKPYLLEVDEFGAAERVGAARIIDISDEAHPKVISDLRLEVHQPENFAAIAGDPGADSTAYGGYAAHYCDVPTTVDPTIVACSMMLSGLRIFDIRDPYHPRETAYYNAPVQQGALATGPPSNCAYARPAFAPERKEVWYTDVNSGFYAVRITNGAWP